MCIDWLKYIFPLIGVGLGVLITPYIDSRKSKKESKHALNCFYSELNDYKSDTHKYVSSFHEGYIKSKKTSMGVISKNVDLFPLTYYPKINFLTIEKLIEKSFLDLTKDQRKAIKALKIISDSINKNIKVLSQLKTVEEFKGSESIFMSATNTSASFHYLVNRLSNEKNRFTYFDTTSEETCKTAMMSLGLSFDDSVFDNTHN